MQVQAANQVFVCSFAKKSDNSCCHHSPSPDTFSTALIEFLSLVDLERECYGRSFYQFLWTRRIRALEKESENGVSTQVAYAAAFLGI